MTRIQRAGRSALVTAAVLCALSCGDDEGPVGNAGSIQLAVSPATVAAPQGQTGTVTATLTRTGGYTGAVTISVDGLPAGATSGKRVEYEFCDAESTPVFLAYQDGTGAWQAVSATTTGTTTTTTDPAGTTGAGTMEDQSTMEAGERG